MTKTKQFFKDLLYSIFDTTKLFKFHKYNWWAPLCILAITAAIMIAPILIVYNTLSADDITIATLHLEKAMADTLSKGFDCKVENNELVCAENYSYFDSSYTDENDLTTTYRVYVNTNVSGIDFNIAGYDTVTPTDNYIIFFKETFTYRYTQRDPLTKTYNEYKLTSFYDNLNGFNFLDIYNTYNGYSDSNEAKTYLIEQAEYLLVEGYRAVAYEAIFTTITTSIGSYLLFIVVAALLIKGNYLLKKNTGFTFTQSIKITLVASLQSLLIALVLNVMGIDFANAIGIALFVRIIYIYIRYTGSRKNTQWIETLYNEYHDERFNI